MGDTKITRVNVSCEAQGKVDFTRVILLLPFFNKEGGQKAVLY